MSNTVCGRGGTSPFSLNLPAQYVHIHTLYVNFLFVVLFGLPSFFGSTESQLLQAGYVGVLKCKKNLNMHVLFSYFDRNLPKQFFFAFA